LRYQHCITQAAEVRERVGEVDDADLMSRAVVYIGSDQLEIMADEMDGLEAQGIFQAGDLFVEGLQQAGDGEAYFEREGRVGFRKFRFNGGPGRQGFISFGKGLLLEGEFRS
jgi:hypothetical protein